MADDIDQSIRELVQLQNTYNTTLHAIQILIREIESLREENEALQLEEDWEESVSWTPLAKTLYIARQIEAHPEMEGVVWESLSEKLSSLRLDLTNLRSEEQQ